MELRISSRNIPDGHCGALMTVAGMQYATLSLLTRGQHAENGGAALTQQK
jgi:hypothetical protein